MGLTFHYSGSIRKEASLAELIAEVKDIAEINGWHYRVFEPELPEVDFGKETFDDKIYGIYFSPTGSEPVWLCFLSNGRLSNPHLMEMHGHANNAGDRKNLYLLSTKTQYAGMTTHKIVVDLLKYIDKKYLANFRVYDEAQYWETGDEKLLQEIFRRYNAAIDILDDALRGNEKLPDESYEDYFRRILKQKGLT